MNSDKESIDNEELEVDLVLYALLKKSGFDYRNYSKSHIKRRLNHRLAVSGFLRYSDLIPKIIYSQDFLETIISDLSINVTEMYRDPEFFKEVKELLFPYIMTYPFIKIWHAGCSSGQEVYSMAILLKESNIYEKSQIYATDFNSIILNKAKEGIYPLEYIKKYSNSYREGGGEFSFGDYYTTTNETAQILPSLKKNILFSFHNLVTDGVFGEMNVIVCRNVLIYFDKELQGKVLRLFYDSLTPGGFLCLGSKESIRFSDVEHLFEVISSDNKIFRKRVL